jgi:hypothetical protein
VYIQYKPTRITGTKSLLSEQACTRTGRSLGSGAFASIVIVLVYSLLSQALERLSTGNVAARLSENILLQLDKTSVSCRSGWP